MSDIAKKTLPRGSWPGSKRGAKTTETASERGSKADQAAPRSVPSPPADLSKSHQEQEGHDVVPATSGDFSEGDGDYTHQEQRGQDGVEEEGELIEEPESFNGSQQQEAEGTQESGYEEEPTKLQGKDTEEEDESLKEVEPEPISETQDQVSAAPEEESVKPDESVKPSEKQEQQEQEEATTEKGEEGVKTPAKSGTESNLTEEAKRAFDQASENQPTDEARESFLKSAQDNLETGASAVTDQTKPKSQPAETEKEEEEQQPEGEALEKAETQTLQKEGSEIQEQEQEQEQAKTATEAAPTVSGKETVPAASEKATEAKEAPSLAEYSGAGETQQGPPSEKEETAAAVSEKATEAEQPSLAEYSGEGEIQPSEGPPSESHPSEQLDTAMQQTQSQGQQEFEGTDFQPEEPQEGMVADQTEGSTVAEQMDFSVLKDGKVNKGGNVVSPDGKIVGRVVSGILQYVVNKRVDENGDIWSDSGKVIGKAEPISESERDEMLKEPAPFESFPDAVVDGNGMVVSNGEWVGKVVEGDVKVLRGKSVDPDGDILDKGGNVIGKAERWEPEPEEEPEPEPEVDKSILAGKRVNKAGNVVDGAGVIFGRVVEGDVKRMVGRMCDKNGNILSESGDVLGKADIVSEGEREGMKEGPFAELEGCTVAKDGTVVTPSGDIVGRLIQGDGRILYGRSVDEDGDILDRNGNVIGKAERWEPEEVQHPKNPMSGRRVNREGNVVDADGNIIGKLTSGDPQICSGKEIDDDGDVVDYKGTVIGHCSLLEDIPKAEEESPEEKEKREQAERDKKLAQQMAVCIEQCLDKIRPICKMITEKIDKAERTPEDERDEEQLVREVRPLIEEGGRILTEAKGIIKGLDPDGRISANAKHKTAAREATPEEYHLADVLKDLTGDVTQCIENAKKKLEDMPHAKKELNPLWGLLNEPLFQILAAVGLLLSGVLNLVGRLLGGLGLGGLVDGLLGTLGLNRVLEGLGLGSFSESLKSGKKKKGGLLGGILGG